jgi:hypothetical protein
MRGRDKVSRPRSMEGILRRWQSSNEKAGASGVNCLDRNQAALIGLQLFSRDNDLVGAHHVQPGACGRFDRP